MYIILYVLPIIYISYSKIKTSSNNLVEKFNANREIDSKFCCIELNLDYYH